MGVPLKAGNRTFGALVVQTYSKNRRFGEPDKEILTFVSQQLASAIEHKKNEQALRRSEARYRSLVQATASIVWGTPASGEFETEQPGWTAFTGQKFEELKGWGWLKAVHAERVELVSWYWHFVDGVWVVVFTVVYVVGR